MAFVNPSGGPAERRSRDGERQASRTREQVWPRLSVSLGCAVRFGWPVEHANGMQRELTWRRAARANFVVGGRSNCEWRSNRVTQPSSPGGVSCKLTVPIAVIGRLRQKGRMRWVRRFLSMRPVSFWEWEHRLTISDAANRLIITRSQTVACSNSLM